MSDKDKFTQKWAIIIPLEKQVDGSEFYYTDFPLHITLAGVFTVSDTVNQFEGMLSELASKTKPFEVIADQEAMFGENKDVTVMTIRKSPELMNLYELVQEELSRRGAVFNAPQHEGEGYIPHSTHQKSGHLHPGEKVLAHSVSLVDLFPNGDGHMRKITKTFEFSSN